MTLDDVQRYAGHSDQELAELLYQIVDHPRRFGAAERKAIVLQAARRLHFYDGNTGY